MTTVRRRILRPQRTTVDENPRRLARMARQREQLVKSRASLKRWLTRLKRAANTVADLHQRIGRLESVTAG